MFRGFYTVASGMLAQQRTIETLTNNLANVHTPGYKADRHTLRAFPEMLISHLQKGQVAPNKLRRVGILNTGVYMQEGIPNFEQGVIQTTGLATDLALENGIMPVDDEGIRGTVLFLLEDPEGGTLYTRNGNFTLDADGYLTSASGHYVLDWNGERIQLASPEFQVDDEGWIIQNGDPVARIGIALAENPRELAKRGDGFYALTGGADLPSAYTAEGVTFKVRQGALEQSNVDPARTMTEMLAAYRTFEANQKVLQAYDRSMDKAVNEIGKVGP